LLTKFTFYLLLNLINKNVKEAGRGFPLEYYPGEYLTRREAERNRKKFYISMVFLVTITVAVNISTSEVVSLGTQTTPVHKLQSTPTYPKVVDSQTEQDFRTHSEKVVNDLRGGNLIMDFFMIIAYTLFVLTQQKQAEVDAFQQPSLPVRNRPHINDRFINIEGRPRLIIRHGQANKKLQKHGYLYNVPATEKIPGKPRSLRTEKNLKTFMDGIVDFVTTKEDSLKWVEKDFYQQSTAREVKAILLFDSETKILIVFKRATGEFITTCRLDI